MVRAEIRGIGGGISYGFCRQSDPAFRFPVCSVGGRRYRLGAVLDADTDLDPALEVVTFRVQMGLFRRLRKQNARGALFTGGRPSASWIATPTFCKGYPEMFIGEEPPWATDLSLGVPETLWVGPDGEAEGQGFQATLDDRTSGLHPREQLIVDHLREGLPVPPVPPVSATQPPTGPGELVYSVNLDGAAEFGPLKRPTFWD